MSSLQICMLAVLGVTAITVLRKWNSDFVPLLRLALAMLLSLGIFVWLAPIISYLRTVTEASGISGYAEFLFKALAVALLTQLCAELCRESGETGAANGVELAGKAEILLLCLPLLSEILDTVKELLAIGG